MKCLNCYSLKGGVGKTTTAVTLASIAAAEGWRVVIWDLDPQGASSFLLRVRRAKGKALTRTLSGEDEPIEDLISGSDIPGVDLIPYGSETASFEVLLTELEKPRRSAKRFIDEMAREYDLLIIDSPPTAGRLANIGHTISDLTLYLTTPSQLSIRSLDEYFSNVLDGDRKSDRRSTLIALTMFERRRSSDLSALEMLRARKEPTVAEAVIPRSAYFEQMAARRLPIDHIAPRSQPSIAYHALWDEVEKRLNLQGS